MGFVLEKDNFFGNCLFKARDDGFAYKGEFVNGMLEGQGLYCFLGTNEGFNLIQYPPFRQILKYKGNFKGNKFDGEGKLL